MIDWVYKLLYKASRALFQVLDAMIYSAKKLCGIEDIYVNGEETDFLSYLFRSSKIQYAFSIAAIAASTLCVFLAVIGIIRAIVKERNESPTKIALSAAKNIFVFLFVPVLMYVTMAVMNAFGQVMYNATMGDDISTMGGYLFTTFAEAGDAWKSSYSEDFISSFNGEIIASYTDISTVESYINIEDFGFIMSWITSILLMFPIGTMLIMFVDRSISIVILYIAAPFSIASSIVDDGARFKLWREQVLTKFITGYGAIIGLNIYAVCMNLVMSNSVVFFPNTTTQILPFFSNNFLNLLVKLLFLVGGAFSMQKIMSLVGNLVSQGAGSNELRDSAIASSGMGRFLGKAGNVLKGAVKTAGKAVGKVGSGIGNITGISGAASKYKEDLSNRFSESSKKATNWWLNKLPGGKGVKERTDQMADNNAPLNKKTLAEVLDNALNKGKGSGESNDDTHNKADKIPGQDTIKKSVEKEPKVNEPTKPNVGAK